MSRNRRIASRILSRPQTPAFKGKTPYLSHNPPPFWHTRVLNRLMPLGAAGDEVPGKGEDHS
jgi:hypothetical protein